MKKNNFWSGLIVSFLLLFAQTSQAAGLLSGMMNAILNGVNQMGNSGSGNNNGGGGGGNNNGGGNNSNGFGGGMMGGPGGGNNNNNNMNLGGGSQVSTGSPNGTTAPVATTPQNVIALASNPGMIPIPRCSAGTFTNIKFPRYSAGAATAMPANARPENFSADLPSGSNSERTTLPCSSAITAQARAVDGNNYVIEGTMQFACLSGSWMLENSSCHAVIAPPPASGFAGAGGTPTTPNRQTLNGVTCPTGSTPTIVTTTILYGAAAGSVECRLDNPSAGVYPTGSVQTVNACGTSLAGYGGSSVGC